MTNWQTDITRKKLKILTTCTRCLFLHNHSLIRCIWNSTLMKHQHLQGNSFNISYKQNIFSYLVSAVVSKLSRENISWAVFRKKAFRSAWICIISVIKTNIGSSSTNTACHEKNVVSMLKRWLWDSLRQVECWTRFDWYTGVHT